MRIASPWPTSRTRTVSVESRPGGPAAGTAAGGTGVGASASGGDVTLGTASLVAPGVPKSRLAKRAVEVCHAALAIFACGSGAAASARLAPAVVVVQATESTVRRSGRRSATQSVPLPSVSPEPYVKAGEVPVMD